MGEYAKFGKHEIKIGTCENLYYLRADQAHRVRRMSGNVDPNSAADRDFIRFRFPWPDEDAVEPGAFDKYDRNIAAPCTLDIPDDVEHGIVQFVAPEGYNVCLPCPEGKNGATVTANGSSIQVHRNGFRGSVLISQQAYRGGKLVTICRCGGCGSLFRLDDAQAAKLSAACLSKGEKEKSRFWTQIGDRIAAGYELKVVAVEQGS